MMIRITKAIEKADKVASFISKAGAALSALSIALTTVMIFAYIINRAFIGQVWLFVEEWTALALIPMSYLGMSYTLRWNRHIYVDILINKFKPKVKNILSVMVSIFSLVVLGFMIERSFNWFLYTLRDNIRSSGPMRTPLWIFSLALTVGLIMFSIDTLFYMLHKLLKAINHKAKLDFHD